MQVSITLAHRMVTTVSAGRHHTTDMVEPMIQNVTNTVMETFQKCVADPGETAYSGYQVWTNATQRFVTY